MKDEHAQAQRSPDDRRLMRTMAQVDALDYAERLDNGEPYDAAAAAEVIRSTFARHLR